MEKSKCPVCASDVIIEDDAYEGDPVTCANCEANLEIHSLHPIILEATELDDFDDDEDEEIE